MHGRIKTRTTAEQEQIKRKEREHKVSAYKTAFQKVSEKRSGKIFDQGGLELTAGMLLGNPDITTLWNYRREVFLHMKDAMSDDDFNKLLEKDLSLAEQCLRVNPKSYGSWHHRVWVLDNLPNYNWKKEVALCTKYLEYDERNFHGWDYRRVVTSRCKVPDMDEYKYTLQKINSNFSNYSAWHLRSKLLPKLFPDMENKLPIVESKHKEELDLVLNAAFTDPNDQSAWFYKRWLLGLTDPKMQFVAAKTDDNSVTVAFSKKVIVEGHFVDAGITVHVDGCIATGCWSSGSSAAASFIWTFVLDKPASANSVMVLKLLQNESQVDQITIDSGKTCLQQPKFAADLSPAMTVALEAALVECILLLEIEPNSKWALLASIWIMKALNLVHYQHSILANIAKLVVVDPLRTGYYNDLCSKVKMELAIMHFYKSPGNVFELSNAGLTNLYHLQYLMTVGNIKFSRNSLEDSALANLGLLSNCRTLHLDKNHITNLSNVPSMSGLVQLFLSDNQLISTDSMTNLSRFPQLKQLELKRNPISCTDDLKYIATLVPQLTISDC